VTEERQWNVYLAGEVHSDWREELAGLAQDAGLPATFTAPVTDHEASDRCGVDLLGPETSSFWGDHKAASINAMRNRVLMQEADMIVVRFGPKYRQWASAFDAGCAAAMGLPIITLHDEELDHALKEIDAAAAATARTVEQVVRVLAYIMSRRESPEPREP
jgi:YtoQ family protein